MKKVVRKEIIHLLNLGIIYHVNESDWVSRVHFIPKKEGFAVVANEHNELIPTRIVVGYRLCIDFRKLNKETRKDHYPLPFIDQTLGSLNTLTFVIWMDILDSLKLMFILKTNLKPLLLALLVCMLTSNAFRFMQCTCYFSEMYDCHFFLLCRRINGFFHR
jgi:hypothetical protein